MMHLVESGDDYYEPRFSNGLMSCLVPPTTYINGPRRSLSYDQLYRQPLRLTVLKLDGSSFRIEAEKTGTVGDLKRAVEAAFCHLPKKGPGRVSWQHVWGQFCLCHEGQKLLCDDDYIGMIGIKDGDQLEFVQHASYTHHLLRVQSVTDDLDSDEEPGASDNKRDGQQNSERDDGQCVETLEDSQDDHGESDDGVISNCDYSLAHLLRGWFRYHKLSTQMRVEERSSSSRFSCNVLGSLKNYLRFSCKRHDSRRETWKGE